MCLINYFEQVNHDLPLTYTLPLQNQSCTKESHQKTLPPCAQHIEACRCILDTVLSLAESQEVTQTKETMGIGAIADGVYLPQQHCWGFEEF